MRKRYDFSNARPNPYAKRLKRQITFASTKTPGVLQEARRGRGIPYQTLIISTSARTRKKPAMKWKAA
jgi:hypothetical protein